MTTSSAEAVRKILCTVRRIISCHWRPSRVQRACIPIGCMLALATGHAAMAADQAKNASSAAPDACAGERRTAARGSRHGDTAQRDGAERSGLPDGAQRSAAG